MKLLELHPFQISQFADLCWNCFERIPISNTEPKTFTIAMLWPNETKNSETTFLLELSETKNFFPQLLPLQFVFALQPFICGAVHDVYFLPSLIFAASEFRAVCSEAKTDTKRTRKICNLFIWERKFEKWKFQMETHSIALK